MKYIPNSEATMSEMLKNLGLNSFDDLFADVPESVRLRHELHLEAPKSEMEIRRLMASKANQNLTAETHPCFLGAGVYDHYIPVAIDQLILRSEFYTAYTPYQPEISQGILQSIFEYQTMICRLTGLDVSNASLYDGGSALAEACKIAAETTKRKKILIPETVHPEYAEIVKTYSMSEIMEPVTVPMTSSGVVDLQQLQKILDEDGSSVAAVAVSYPNFFGCLEDVEAIRQMTEKNKSLLIMSVNPLSLAILKSPGEFKADIAVGDGQTLGIPMSFGGPHLGFIAVTNKLMRKIPGRLVGQTTDQQGRRAFVLTLQAREQHIRRAQASTNICSNQALCALTASMYLTFVGPKGLEQVAKRCHFWARYAQTAFQKAGLRLLYDATHFNEFVVELKSPQIVNQALLKAGMIGGYELPNGLMFAFTEKRTKDEIDSLVAIVKEANHA
ncbi:MAG: aminomethyl-transferring glycine dehydrogenase subunit GcvPA [Thermoguttaceae bacterium]